MTNDEITSNESGTSVTRSFGHAYNVAGGTYTRTGTDGQQTVVQLDAAGRVQTVKRQTSGSLPTIVMQADYAYLPNGLASTMNYANGTSVQYSYDVSHRPLAIEHRNIAGAPILRMVYTYSPNGLPLTITETAGSPGATIATVSYTYDRRGRLTSEVRNDVQLPSRSYDLSYQYDKGGNRTLKIDSRNNQRVEYTYDVSDPSVYFSASNRLIKYSTYSEPLHQLVSTTYYRYNTFGNVAEIITEPVGGGGSTFAASSSGTGFLTTTNSVVSEGGVSADGTTVDPTLSADAGATIDAAAGGDGSTQALAGGGDPCALYGGGVLYTSVRFGYANNGRAVTSASGEQWC
ncbi:MAG: hypothetical protein AABZ12_14270, partial [Planctomycetota bacterium]